MHEMHLNLEFDTMMVAGSSEINQGTKGVAFEVVGLIYIIEAERPYFVMCLLCCCRLLG